MARSKRAPAGFSEGRMLARARKRMRLRQERDLLRELALVTRGR